MIEYIIERHTHGWLVKAPPNKSGVPMAALSELSGVFPKDASIWIGIATALEAVFAIATKSEGAAWEAEIKAGLEKAMQAEIAAGLEKAMLSSKLQWLRGVDTGASSRTIFFHLCGEYALQIEAASCGPGFDQMDGHPHDSADFGRCDRLLKIFPEWRARLPELAAKMPDTKWPKLVAKWDELSSIYATGGSVTKAIQNL